MTYQQLINEVGNSFIVDLYLKGAISYLQLANELGNSAAELVADYQKQHANN